MPPQSPSSFESMDDKAEEIRRILSEPTVDLWRLRELALSEGGLVNDSLRKLAWPKLVGVSHLPNQHNLSSSATSPAAIRDDDGDTTTNNDKETALTSLDSEQIERDVSRVTWHLLTGNQRSRNFQMRNKHRKRIAQLLRKKQRRLGDYLNLVLVLSYYDEEGGSEDGVDDVQSPMSDVEGDRLRYYQGFHDVGSIVLSALGGASLPVVSSEDSSLASQANIVDSNDVALCAHETASSMGLGLACQVLLRLSRSHLRDAMRSNFMQLQSALKLIVMPLTAAFDPRLHAHLADCEMEPYFCLSWVITWFGHDVRDTALVKRLYDFFIVSHPLMPVYMSVAMMIHPLNRIEVLGADCDFACVHNALADLPKNSSNVGWKYLPGDQGNNSGYATGEDDEMSYDPSLQDQSIDEGDDGSVGLSSAAGGHLSRSNRARVPFQELIDLSVSLMHKIPPRNLINLAQRYHTEITLQPLMAQSSSIALLQPPPSWGLTSHTDSDWVLRQKMREELGCTKLNRHQRKKRLEQLGGVDTGTISTHPLLEKASINAIIASGTGPDGRAEERKRRKKRKMMVRSAAVVVLAVLVALARSYFSRQPAQPPSLSPSHSQQQLTRDLLTEKNVAELVLDDKGATEDTRSEDSLSCDEPVQEAESSVATQEKELAQDPTVETSEDNGALWEDAEVTDKVQEEKKTDGTCENDEATDDGFLAQVQCQPAETTETEGRPTMPSADHKTQATLLVLVKSSVLFVRNLTTIQNQTMDLHLDQLERHFDFLMTQLMDLLQLGWHAARLGWAKIAPVLVNAIQIGWRHIRMGLIKMVPVVRDEFVMELEGEPMEWAEDAMRTWKKQEALLKKQGKFIHSVVSDVRKRAKAGKEKTKEAATAQVQ